MRVSLLSLLPVLAAPLAAEPTLVASLPAKVVPEQVAVLTLPERGLVTDFADTSHRLEAGAVVAVINKQRTAEEREDMELQISKDLITRKDEQRKLRQQKEKLTFYLGLNDQERKYADPSLPEDVPPTRASLADINERIELSQKETATLAQRRRSEFARTHDGLTLRMPFAGRLQYNVTLPEDPENKPFENTGMVQTFATACDDSSFYITLSISQSDLSLLSEKNFSVRVALPEGRELRAPYAFRRVERSNSGGDMLVYFFRLPDEDAETAYSMLGSNATADLYYEAGEGVERVSKARLAARPEAAECESWAELVQRVYPGSVIVIVAEKEVVIRHVQGAPASP